MKDLKTCIRGFSVMMKPVRARVGISIAIGLVRIAASLYFVSLCKSLVDIATGCSTQNLGRTIFLLVAVMLTQILAGAGGSWWNNYNIVKTGNSLQREFFSHALGSEWKGRDEYHSGDLVNRLEEDIKVVVDIICTRIPDVVITIGQLLAASVYLMMMAPKLLWLLLVLMAIGVFGSKLFFKTLRRLTSEIRAAESRIQQIMQENLQHRIVVIMLTGPHRVIAKLAAVQEETERLVVRRLNYNAVARGFMSLGFMGGYASAFLWGVFGIISGDVTFGMMTAFLQLVGQVQRPIAELSRHIPAFIHALTSEERLMELGELQEMSKDAGMPEEGPGAIVFDNVSYSYPGYGKKILDGFSFTFEAGKLTAIVGSTGAGKSTLVRLAMGLLKPTSGKVGIWSRANYMYVPQGNSLMSGTIRENLLLARPEATEEEMRDVLETAEAGFVFRLAEGLDSRCGEVGSGLSEGQAQRIAVARALLHDGGVLILDEASSALDAATEERMLGNIISKYRGKKTILFVSHREKIFEMADAVCHIQES